MATKNIYHTDNFRNIVFTKNLLEYSEDYSRSVAKSSLWYLDLNSGTAAVNTGFEARRVLTQANENDGGGGAKDANVIIPLNRYSFFEEQEDKMLVPIQLQLAIELNDDGELIHKANAADNGRVALAFYGYQS